MRLGVVAGLAAELRCLKTDERGSGTEACCRGMGPAAARAAARDLVGKGCSALLSFGLAGGLDPDLRPGDVVLADSIIDEGTRLLPADPAWRRRLAARLIAGGRPAASGRIFASERPLLDVAEKRAAAARTGAVAVDMESAAVAEVALAAGLPFLAVRAIADCADEAVPGWLAGVIDHTGRPRLRAVAAGCLTHPRDLRQLLRLASRQRAALAALRRVGGCAGPLFALA